MFALFIVLNRTEYLRKVLRALKDAGIRGATVIDSLGAGQLMREGHANVPIIGGFIRSLEGDYKSNKTIFSVIEREEQVEKAMKNVKETLGGELKPGTGIMFCVPVVKFCGGELEQHIEKRERRKLMEKEFQSEYY